jgi:hypothetical protein
MAGTTYQPKIYLHKYLMRNIKSLKINFIQLNYKEFYQTPVNQHQIKNLLISTFKIWVTEKLYNDLKIILECYKWLFGIIWIKLTKITDGINLFKSCSSHFYLMIDSAKEVLEDRISTDYKKILDLLEKEKLAMAYILGKIKFPKLLVALSKFVLYHEFV